MSDTEQSLGAEAAATAPEPKKVRAKKAAPDKDAETTAPAPKKAAAKKAAAKKAAAKKAAAQKAAAQKAAAKKKDVDATLGDEREAIEPTIRAAKKPAASTKTAANARATSKTSKTGAAADSKQPQAAQPAENSKKQRKIDKLMEGWNIDIEEAQDSTADPPAVKVEPGDDSDDAGEEGDDDGSYRSKCNDFNKMKKHGTLPAGISEL